MSRERIIIITTPPPALADMDAKCGTPTEAPYPEGEAGQVVITVEYDTPTPGVHAEAIQGYLETAVEAIADELDS